MAVSTITRRWVKIWHEILTDQPFQDLTLEQQARFYNLLVYTSAHGEKGALTVTPPARALIHLLQCKDYEDFKETLGKLRHLKNLKIASKCNGEIIVTFEKWHKYQIDDSSARVGKFRQNVTVQEKEKEEEKDKEVKQFIDYAFQSFQTLTGKRLCIDGGKDGSIVKKLLGTYGFDELKGLWEVFMRTTDPFVTEQAGFSIGVFKSQINKLLMAKPKKDWQA